MNADALAYLAEKGLSIQEIIEFARLSERKRDNTAAERQARYRQRRDVTPPEWEVIRFQIFERDGFACTYCGETEELACDHIVPLVQGGLSTPDNLTTACRACNSEKSGRTPGEWLGDGD